VCRERELDPQIAIRSIAAVESCPGIVDYPVHSVTVGVVLLICTMLHPDVKDHCKVLAHIRERLNTTDKDIYKVYHLLLDKKRNPTLLKKISQKNEAALRAVLNPPPSAALRAEVYVTELCETKGMEVLVHTISSHVAKVHYNLLNFQDFSHQDISIGIILVVWTLIYGHVHHEHGREHISSGILHTQEKVYEVYDQVYQDRDNIFAHFVSPETIADLPHYSRNSHL
jgi:hypothetical protein